MVWVWANSQSARCVRWQVVNIVQQTTELDGNGACPTCHPAHCGHPFGSCLALCLSKERGSAGCRCIELCTLCRMLQRRPPDPGKLSIARVGRRRGVLFFRSSFGAYCPLCAPSLLCVSVFVLVTQASSVLTAGCPAITAPSRPSGLSMVSACVESRGTLASGCTRMPAEGFAIYTYSLLPARRQLVSRWHPLRPSNVRGSRGHPLLSFGRALLCKRWRDEPSSYESNFNPRILFGLGQRLRRVNN